MKAIKVSVHKPRWTVEEVLLSEGGVVDITAARLVKELVDQVVYQLLRVAKQSRDSGTTPTFDTPTVVVTLTLEEDQRGRG